MMIFIGFLLWISSLIALLATIVTEGSAYDELIAMIGILGSVFLNFFGVVVLWKSRSLYRGIVLLINWGVFFLVLFTALLLSFSVVITMFFGGV